MGWIYVIGTWTAVQLFGALVKRSTLGLDKRRSGGGGGLPR